MVRNKWIWDYRIYIFLILPICAFLVLLQILHEHVQFLHNILFIAYLLSKTCLERRWIFWYWQQQSEQATLVYSIPSLFPQLLGKWALFISSYLCFWQACGLVGYNWWTYGSFFVYWYQLWLESATEATCLPYWRHPQTPSHRQIPGRQEPNLLP